MVQGFLAFINSPAGQALITAGVAGGIQIFQTIEKLIDHEKSQTAAAEAPKA